MLGLAIIVKTNWVMKFFHTHIIFYAVASYSV